MKLHRNAKLTPAGRAELVRRVLELHLPPSEVAAAMGVSTRTAFKWLARFVPMARLASPTDPRPQGGGRMPRRRR